MSEPRVPVFVLARHKEALALVAETFGCPEGRLLDEAIAFYLKHLERLGLAEPAPGRAGEGEARTAARGEEFWSAVLR
ncbi:MAG: hypothetical protein N2038_00225 [Geminicoccaceae bacterium]|nr:hypothetical protein [Geminicoccaceae bacterium]MCS7266740.1 hypothetical protein [Geminicoccaceae bacterium]MCX7628657.1 hypothetical protein [Geminicoccaceae bacterium]MDW8123762.1 hypothetical protein [Geminicoccaceae bacterium]MDW8341911.1 hypothetical protein [Geminicoccaceae bacterium]